MDDIVSHSVPQLQCSRCEQFKPALPGIFCIDKRCEYGVCSPCRECYRKHQLAMRPPKPHIPEGMKQCSKCKKVYPANTRFFRIQKSSSTGFTSHCKACLHETGAARWAKDHPRDAIPEGQKRCSKCGECKSATSDYFPVQKAKKDGFASWCKECTKVYRMEHAQILQAKKKRYYHEHKGEHALRSKQYVQAHRDRVNQTNRRYEKAHPEQSRAKCHKRRAIKKGVGGFYTAQHVKDMYARQRGHCYYCSAKFGKGKRAYHVDHIMPITRGGSNDPSHLVLACEHCNASKGDKLLSEWPQGNRLL